MTIEINGHVAQMIVSTGSRVQIHIYLAMHRVVGRGPLILELSREEATHYMPGSGVLLQLRPQGEVGKGFVLKENSDG